MSVQRALRLKALTIGVRGFGGGEAVAFARYRSASHAALSHQSGSTVFVGDHVTLNAAAIEARMAPTQTIGDSSRFIEVAETISYSLTGRYDLSLVATRYESRTHPFAKGSPVKGYQLIANFGAIVQTVPVTDWTAVTLKIDFK